MYSPPYQRLIDQVGIADRRQANLVPVSQNPTQLCPRRRNAARHNQRRPSEIDEANFATVDESPPPPKIRRHRQPPTSRDPVVLCRAHRHIVRDARPPAAISSRVTSSTPRALALATLPAGTAQAGNRTCLRSAPALRAFADLPHTLASLRCWPKRPAAWHALRPRPGRGQAAEQRAVALTRAHQRSIKPQVRGTLGPKPQLWITAESAFGTLRPGVQIPPPRPGSV